MACTKCGSSWKTLKGKDCSRCPHCDKVTRSIERKRGRWVDPVQVASCKHCGCEFQEKIVGSARRSYCSESCRKAHKSVWRREWSVGYRKGVRKQQQNKAKKPRPVCKQCGKQFKRQAGSNTSNIYCSQACFFTTRASGLQAWDKTNMVKAHWHRGGQYASAPSVKLMASIQKAHRLIELTANAFEAMAERELARPQCEVCGDPCKDGASRFCSYACNKAWRGERQCKCGVVVPNCTAFGPGPSCVACKRKTVRAWKRLYGKDTRKRVRKGGGYWNPKVRALAVFKRDKWICYLCKARCEKVYDPLNPLSATLDHVWPVSRGGDHDWHNVRTACAGCNAKKGNRVQGQRLLRFG